jgi:hypothetical protein
MRRGWEMWVEERCFGRADSKELLLAGYQRLQDQAALADFNVWRRWPDGKTSPRDESKDDEPVEAAAEAGSVGM